MLLNTIPLGTVFCTSGSKFVKATRIDTSSRIVFNDGIHRDVNGEAYFYVHDLVKIEYLLSFVEVSQKFIDYEKF